MKEITQRNIINDAIVKDVADAVSKLENGSIAIKVHNAKIVELSITEFKNFNEVWHIEGGGI